MNSELFDDLPDDTRRLKAMVAIRNKMIGELHVRLRLAQAKIRRLEAQNWYLKNPKRHEN